MASIDKLSVECGSDSAAASALAAHFEGLSLSGGPVSASASEGDSGDWWVDISLTSPQASDAAAIYERLKEAPAELSWRTGDRPSVLPVAATFREGTGDVVLEDNGHGELCSWCAIESLSNLT